jgi:uncharacterized protein YqjF (DUF2071 family)
VSYSSERTDQRGLASVFRGSYAPSADVEYAAPGSLESFLTDRFSLYTERGGTLLRGDIKHKPWPLQRARADITTNSMMSGLDIKLLSEQPLLHYSDSIDMVAWPLVPVQ